MPYPAKITVITVCLNMARTIEQTIKSVLDQKYPNLEYIVIDGGSSDGTLDIIKKYEDSLARVVSEPDSGTSDALNKGIRMASGDIIGILNADDFYAPWTLETVSRIYENDPDWDVYFGKLVFIDSAETCWKVLPLGSVNRITDCMSIPIPAGFLTKRTFDKWGLFDLSYKIANDWDYMLKIYLDGASFHPIDKVFTAFRSAGMSSKRSCRHWWEYYRVLSRSYGRSSTLLKIGKIIVKHYISSLMQATGTYGIYARLRGRKNWNNWRNWGIELSGDCTGDATSMWDAINAGDNSFHQ